MAVTTGLAACAAAPNSTAAASVTVPQTRARGLRIGAPLRTGRGEGRDFGGRQRAAVDAEAVDGGVEVGVAGVLRPPDPVLRGCAEVRRPRGERGVAGDLHPVDVENAEVPGVRDGDV